MYRQRDSVDDFIDFLGKLNPMVRILLLAYIYLRAFLQFYFLASFFFEGYEYDIIIVLLFFVLSNAPYFFGDLSVILVVFLQSKLIEELAKRGQYRFKRQDEVYNVLCLLIFIFAFYTAIPLFFIDIF